MKKLYFGDCLDILKELHADHPEGFIDLVYIDPPFNSKRDYNVLFEQLDMADATAQKQAFADTWSNVSYVDTLSEIATLDMDLHEFLTALDNIRVSKGAIAYLTMMAIRIHYIHKVLKDTGSFYLHCDPTMSHYLKMVCDLVFGPGNFNNDIAWTRTVPKSDFRQGATNWPRVHDCILYYMKDCTLRGKFNQQFAEYRDEYVKASYSFTEPETGRRYGTHSLTAPGAGSRGHPKYEFLGVVRYWRYGEEKMKKLLSEGRIVQSKPGAVPRYKRYLDEVQGVPIGDMWTDIHMLQGASKERLGYPTQKPEALLERIIQANTNEGNLVADFFCGCGTTIAAAEHLNRNWLGVDISHLAIKLIVKRLTDPYRRNRLKFREVLQSIHVSGMPKDVGSAKELAENTEAGRFGFQEWVVEVMLGGVCNPKKTADGGWDGYLTFNKTDTEKEFILVEVKSGGVNVKNLKEFIHVVDTKKAAMGVLVCFAEHVTKPMLLEAKHEGYYGQDHWPNQYPKIQILTVEEMFEGKTVEMPESLKTTFKSAVSHKSKVKQGDLF